MPKRAPIGGAGGLVFTGAPATWEQIERIVARRADDLGVALPPAM